MPKMLVNGVDLYYELHGNGYPLVLIAGFACDINIWNPLYPLLKKHFQLLIFDHRGAGLSDSPDSPHSIEMMAEDTIKLAEQIGLKRPHVLGHSMGGCIAQALAYHHRDLFSSFAFCNSLVKLSPAALRCFEFQLHLREANLPKELLIEGMLPWLYSNDFLQSPNKIKQVIEITRKNPHVQSLIGYRRQLEALASFDSNDWFNQIEVPALIIQGCEDLLCPHDSEKLAKGISGAKHLKFPNMGHLPMIEKPKEFCNFITHFFLDL